LKRLKKATYLQITDLRKRKKEKGSGIWEKRRSGSAFQWQTSLFTLAESSPHSTKIPFNFLYVAVTDLMFRLRTRDKAQKKPSALVSSSLLGLTAQAASSAHLH